MFPRVALAVCVGAAGCATSLGVGVPGRPQWERRAAVGETAPPAPRRETRLELTLARDANSLLLQARLVDHLTRAGEFRRVRQPLEYAIPWSWFAEHGEHLLALALIPAIAPVTLWHLAWWVYGRGLSPAERAVRPPPWGNELRQAWEQAWWPGVNAEALWRWRAELIPLQDAVTGPWRLRSVVERVPIADRPVGLAIAGEVQPMGATDAHGRTTLAIAPPADATKPWHVGRLRVETAADLQCTASVTDDTGRRLTARATIAPDYLARALRVRALRAEQRATGRTVALHAELAALYTASGGAVQARAEWRRVGLLGSDADRARATAEIAASWATERDTARAAGDVRSALFCHAVAGHEAALRAGTTDRSPLEGGDAVVVRRLLDAAVDTRSATALALASAPGSPSLGVRRALLTAAADHRAPTAAWCALQALIRHPSPDAAAILPTLFIEGVHPALQCAAAQAIFASLPDTGIAVCAAYAHWPAVQWVLADATAAAIDPDAEAWKQWWLVQWPAHRWDADAAMFVAVAAAH